MYSAYKLNKQGDNIQPWHTPFATLNQFVIPCLVLTVASWPAYRFLRRQVRWSGIPISFRIFHSLLWSIQYSSTVKKVLGSTTDFPTWGSGKGDWESLGNLTLKSVGFDYRPSTGLGNRESWRGQKKPNQTKKLVCTRTQEKGAVTPQETEVDLPVFGSLWLRLGRNTAPPISRKLD